MKVLLVQDQASQPQQAEAMPQATNQPAFDPYSVNSYYDEGFYGNQSYDQSYAAGDENFGYHNHPDQDYHGQGYEGDLWLAQQSTVENPVESQTNKYSESHNISCSHIPIRKIQNVIFLINTKVAQLSLDSGCEGDCIHDDECKRLYIRIDLLILLTHNLLKLVVILPLTWSVKQSLIVSETTLFSTSMAMLLEIFKHQFFAEDHFYQEIR